MENRKEEDLLMSDENIYMRFLWEVKEEDDTMIVHKRRTERNELMCK